MFSSLSCKTCNLFYHFSRQSKPCLRNIVFLEKIRPKPSLVDKTHYKIIYDFPYIKLVGPFLRTKRTIPVVGVVICPFLYFLDETKVSPVITLVTAGLYFLFGLAVSKIGRNIIGKIYINKDIRSIMISSIDGFGRRIDRVHNFEDVINSDFPTTVARYLGFIKLDIDNSEMYYLLNLSNCKFIDEDACNCILGYSWDFYDINENKNKNDIENENKNEIEGKDKKKELTA